MTTITFEPIGIIHTPFLSIDNMPIQPMGAKNVLATIELNKQYMEGLKDLDGFSHLTLIYHLHQVDGYQLSVTPFMDTQSHGIFATRSPKRPNAIGISTVKIISINENILTIEEADMLNGTPFLYIKLFFPQFDNRAQVKAGWLDEKWHPNNKNHRSDNRFK